MLEGLRGLFDRNLSTGFIILLNRGTMDTYSNSSLPKSFQTHCAPASGKPGAIRFLCTIL